MSTEERTATTGLSSHNLEHLLNIAEEVKASMIPENNTWIYDSIVDRIHEVGSKEEEIQTVICNIISEYQDEGRYNESLIAVWPDQARIGKENKRRENEILIKKIEILNKVLEFIIDRYDVIYHFLNIDLYQSRFPLLSKVQALDKKGKNTYDIIKEINEENNATYALGIFCYFDFIPQLMINFDCTNETQLSKHLVTWFKDEVTDIHIRIVIQYFISGRRNNHNYDKVMDRITEKFPL